MKKQLPQWLQGKPLEDQSFALAEQCAKAFDSHGLDASKLFNGIRIEALDGRVNYKVLADGEPIQDVAVKAFRYLDATCHGLTVQYDENITGFVWTFTDCFGEPGSASLYPVQE